MSDNILFHDNVRVQGHKEWNEYFAITLATPDEYTPYTSSIRRYCVPGRIDSYYFDVIDGGRSVRFRSEGGDSLPKSLKQAQADLDKPQVIELIVKACETWKCYNKARDLVDNLIESIHPKSKAYKAGMKALAKRKVELLEIKRQLDFNQKPK